MKKITALLICVLSIIPKLTAMEQPASSIKGSNYHRDDTGEVIGMQLTKTFPNGVSISQEEIGYCGSSDYSWSTVPVEKNSKRYKHLLKKIEEGYTVYEKL